MSFVTGLVIIVLIFAVTMTIWLVIQRSYSNEGRIIIEKDETGKVLFTLEIDIDPLEIQNMKNVSFRVVEKHGIAD